MNRSRTALMLAIVTLVAVVALPVFRRRVVNREKHREQVAKRQHRGVERHAHDLGMSGSPGAHVVVGGIGVAPAGVARFDRPHAGELVEHRFQAPEAAAAEDGRFLRA